jgi:hypothetical protein
VSPLLARLDVLIASCTAPSTRDDDLRAALERDAKRYGGLARWNAEHPAAIHAGIHRAADKFLTEPFRSVTDEHRWAGSLWQHLGRRYADYGLERRPCRRVVKEALDAWEPLRNVAPPYGCSSKSG